MTNPENFDYTDDSVIARVAVDIPNQAVGDIKQLSDAMAALQTQLISISRAQGDWVGYIQQIPDIARAANDALDEHITRLERISYLQSETGRGNLAGGVGVGYGGYGAGAPGGGGYSTAAPMGYVPPWGMGTPGMGMGGGGGANAAGAAAEYARIDAENPGLAANMESARGRGINPSMLGMLGAGVANVLGKIKSQDSGKGGGTSAKTPQPGHSDRDSSKAADPTKGGTPEGSVDPAEISEPGEDATIQEKASYYLAKGQQLANEMAMGKSGRVASILSGAGKIMGRGSQVLGGGGGGSGGSNGLFGAAGAIWNKLPTTAKITGGVGAGLMAFNKIQDIGEKVTEFQQLGSVQGGDWMTGMKYEAQARIMALNPFITTQQARQAMQMALKEGFRGDNYDTVQDFMIQNFKELGISMGQSMELMKSQAIGMSEGDDRKGITKDMEQTLNTMKELSAEGGASFPERAKQYKDLSEALAGDGVSPESISRAAVGLQEGYGDSMALRDSITGIAANANKNTMFNTIVARELGITGMLPGALQPAINQRVDPDEALEIGARVIAGYVSGHPDPMNRIANFMSIMNNQYGQDLSWEEAAALLNKVTGGSPSQTANNRVARQGKTETGGGGLAGRGRPGTTSASPSDADWNKNHSNYRASENAAGVAGSFDDAGRASANFAPSGNSPAPLPQAGSPIPVNVSSSGTVTGEVRITVDQAGRVSAPASIQLTGTQKAAYAGYSSAQVNNHSPGDPNYHHEMNSFPPAAGGGG